MPNTKLRPILALRLTLAPARQVRSASSEVRMLYDIRGGRFEGSGLSGRIMPVIGDWVIVKGREITIDVRIRLQTDDGHDIHLSYDKIGDLDPEMRRLADAHPDVDKSKHFFTFRPLLETKSDQLAWLTRMDIVALGIRFDEAIEYVLYGDRPPEA